MRHRRHRHPGQTFKRTIGGFVGVKRTRRRREQHISGPDGVTSHGSGCTPATETARWHVIDLEAPAPSLPSRSSARRHHAVDEMALDGRRQLAVARTTPRSPVRGRCWRQMRCGRSRVISDHEDHGCPAIVPAGFGLSIDQPAWEPKASASTCRSVIANNRRAATRAADRRHYLPRACCDRSATLTRLPRSWRLRSGHKDRVS